ncbi:MAG: hypothetical protein LBK00_02890 [Treponema sp.]|jgi:hypothetical protein|nr:hypothetical protein [Treponema sp.]
MPEQTETRLPWGQDTITIKGRNTGIQHLTVYFDDEQLNILDFLNASLKAEYAAIYEEIMSRYEAKLKTSSIFDHNFPEAQFSVETIEPPNSQGSHPAADKELIEAMLNEYHTRLVCMKTNFKAYEANVEKWFNDLAINNKNL